MPGNLADSLGFGESGLSQPVRWCQSNRRAGGKHVLLKDPCFSCRFVLGLFPLFLEKRANVRFPSFLSLALWAVDSQSLLLCPATFDPVSRSMGSRGWALMAETRVSLLFSCRSKEQKPKPECL